ncbi:carboxymuconolactone decarboxylase family protein [Arthrobacter sp. TmT3-37]
MNRAKDLQAMADNGGILNVFRMMLRNPQVADPVIRLGAAQFQSSSLQPIEREMTALAAGALFEAPFETAQHDPLSRALGITEQQRQAITSQDWVARCFSAKQRVLLRFVAAVAVHPKIPHSMLSDVRVHFTDEQVVDVIVQTGYYFLIARTITVLDVPIDAPSNARVFNAFHRPNS